MTAQIENQTAEEIIEELKSYQPEFRHMFQDMVFENTENIKSDSFIVRLNELKNNNPDKLNNLLEWIREYV